MNRKQAQRQREAMTPAQRRARIAELAERTKADQSELAWLRRVERKTRTALGADGEV